VAARLGLPFTPPVPSVSYVSGTAPATVEVDDLDACPRFTARVLADVTVTDSPAWMQERLSLAGMRPINNVVDVSNYVMLELGHPNHAYDLAALPGRGLRVRRARVGESLVTLDEVERRFTAGDLLICDAEDTPVGIAGIMGGASSEVRGTTTELLLETAYFDPLTIAWTSKRLTLRSEASARFEKGVDPEGVVAAADRFCELLAATATDVWLDVRGPVTAPAPVRVRTARVNGVLGTSLDDDEIKGLLDPIGFATVVTAEGQLDVVIPTFRPDSATEVDVVEEVGRMYGYSRIAPTMPSSNRAGRLTPEQKDRRLVRSILAGAGVSEAWTTTFVSAADLERCGLDVASAVVVANPLAVEESLLRPSLVPGLVRALAYNASHRLHGIRLFEVGNVFTVVDRMSLPDEREVVGVALAGGDATDAVGAWTALAEGLALLDARLEPSIAPGLHPTRTAAVIVEGATVGWVGEVDPAVLEASAVPERVGWLEVDLMALLHAARGPESYQPVRRFPSSDLDLSFEVADAVVARDLERALRATGIDELVDVRLLDAYRGSGRRSLTYRVRLQAADRTLTDTEIGALRTQLIAAVETAHLGTLRA
jgi:phenylalanyl-tRNA synthetase beta chain